MTTSPAKNYAPSFRISIKGEDLIHGVSAYVQSVSVTDNADKGDSFTFSLIDRHPEPARFAGGTDRLWMDSDLFDEGTEVEIYMGYVDNLPSICGSPSPAVTTV